MSLLLCLVFLLLMPLAPAGLALVHQGLGRSRSAAHTMLATMCALGVAAIVFVVLGSAWAGYAGGSFHTLSFSGMPVNWLGAERVLAGGVRARGVSGLHAGLELCLEMVAAGMVALIPISAGGDRWKLSAICAASAAISALAFPLFVHAIWSGGWLDSMAAQFGLARFMDVGGAGVIQVLGGLSALSVAWLLGPRRGKYHSGSPSAIPGHNIVLVMFGCMLALVGWAGLECAASMLFYDVVSEQLVWVLVNVMLAAGSGLLAALATTRFRYRKPDSSMSANGWVAGLVAGSAGCGLFSPGTTILVGLGAGILVTLSVEAFEMDLLVDDPGGAVSVHAVAGIWGLLAFGLVGQLDGVSRGALLLAQLVGIATLLGAGFPLLHGLHLALNRVVPYRVDRDGDWQGMDIRELGSGAYPEFVMHADDFVPR